MRNTSRKAKISQKLDFCEDFIFSPTNMEIYSDDEILIRGCFGIISYDEKEITVKAKEFNVKICGEKLVMRAGGDHILYISGKIFSVNFLREDKK